MQSKTVLAIQLGTLLTPPSDLIAALNLSLLVADRSSVHCSSKELCLQSGKEDDPTLAHPPMHLIFGMGSVNHSFFSLRITARGVWCQHGPKHRSCLGLVGQRGDPPRAGSHWTHILPGMFVGWGPCLATNSEGLIRLGHACSWHATSSKTSRERLANKIILGRVTTSSFLRSNSNL
jgi:hypothetical protein